jgi:hypothetical protein
MRRWSYWKPRALRHVARLEEQIKFLDDKFYTGCGFHYSLQPNLQATKRQISNLETSSEVWWRYIVAKVRLEQITVTIKAAVTDAKRRAAI